jgi:hypothetical protein
MKMILKDFLEKVERANPDAIVSIRLNDSFISYDVQVKVSKGNILLEVKKEGEIENE